LGFWFLTTARGLFEQEDFRKEVAVMRGTSDDGGARVVARVWFGAKLMSGDVGERCTQAYIGVWQESYRIKI
jgi:hypothetical protein